MIQWLNMIELFYKSLQLVFTAENVIKNIVEAQNIIPMLLKLKNLHFFVHYPKLSRSPEH